MTGWTHLYVSAGDLFGSLGSMASALLILFLFIGKEIEGLSPVPRFLARAAGVLWFAAMLCAILVWLIGRI